MNVYLHVPYNYIRAHASYGQPSVSRLRTDPRLLRESCDRVSCCWLYRSALILADQLPSAHLRTCLLQFGRTWLRWFHRRGPCPSESRHLQRSYLEGAQHGHNHSVHSGPELRARRPSVVSIFKYILEDSGHCNVQNYVQDRTEAHALRNDETLDLRRETLEVRSGLHIDWGVPSPPTTTNWLMPLSQVSRTMGKRVWAVVLPESIKNAKSFCQLSASSPT